MRDMWLFVPHDGINPYMHCGQRRMKGEMMRNREGLVACVVGRRSPSVLAQGGIASCVRLSGAGLIRWIAVRGAGREMSVMG